MDHTKYEIFKTIYYKGLKCINYIQGVSKKS
jgi:hypothetical protein